MTRQTIILASVAVFLAVLWSQDAQAATRNWGGSTDGDWSVAGNWTENAVPADGDIVVVGSGSILLANSTDATIRVLHNIMASRFGLIDGAGDRDVLLK